MRGLSLFAGALVLQGAAVQAAPSLFYVDPVASANQVALSSSLQSATLNWATKAADAITHSLGLGGSAGSLADGDEGKSILDIINGNDDFRQLAHVLNYSSDSTKQLLDSKDKKLTFFAPVNWHGEHHGGDGDDHDGDHQALAHRHAATQHWNFIEHHIALFEQDYGVASHGGGHDDDDDNKKRRREIIQHLIDAEAYYHLVRSDEPIDSKTLAENSTVASQLNTGTEHRYNDGTDWRIRVGKSLLPIPGIYLNTYSRVVKPDLKAQNGLIHAIKYPLLLPPDVLQSLFFGQTTFSTTTSALQKVHAAKYLAYRPFHGHGHGHGHHDGKDGDDKDSFPGVAAETFFAPTNLAWSKLPFTFRAYLFSPWGYHLLQKVFMLHSLPSDIVYADFVHHVERSKKHRGPATPREISVDDDSQKTSYTFDSVLPAINGTGKGEYEQVDVDVYRYHLVPGGKGPLQTRVVVQGVPVIVQDLPAANGVFHAIDSFIKPKGHPHKGLWADIAREAQAAGFGTVDLEREARLASW
ncbi:uncharacterized protein PFL1_01944 [Pseudozyma flocculosa PF-1]|uniref:FAS1 domain-containing protein n=1 Tax=Pseudozyma flocculosa TaxID=84751 RepID=A0A5C3EYY7_9BASI|nr:uncharacterized protein PFL1_01944 [Pseudozyma flocculosa PF-1]EPQ30418.1 hypothetical protein PFL1_01944 [Pseudozyma flocculosa PF-1]SPO37493.1 uncharacterized protein PSFLO_02968 [Pseudozyma flocculosa]